MTSTANSASPAPSQQSHFTGRWRFWLSGNSGWLVEGGGYAMTYYAVAGITLLGLVLCLLGRVGDERQLPGAAQ